MKSVLLVATSLAVLVSPAASTSAQEFTGGQQFRDGPGAPSERFTMRPMFRGGFGSAFDCDGRDGRHRHGRRNIALSECAAFPVGLGYFDQDINRSWDSDSFNDWWNDRPDRAYPRWIYHNQNCTPDRMWWSGSGWHC